MIPLWLKIHIDARPSRRLRLWLPLFLLWLVLIAIAIALAPLVALFCLLRRINPIPVSCAPLQVLSGVRGTHVEIHTHRLPS